MKIVYRKPGFDSPRTGVVVKEYEVGKYLVKEDDPVPGQPSTRFVFGPEIISLG